MSLFNRNKSGQTYDGKERDRKGFIDVVDWQMEEEEIIYKFPYNNLTTGTVLIVNESQQAFLYKNGVMYDSFGAGRHELSTANIPFLQKFLNLPTGGQTTFTAEVWFVNTEVVKRNVPWGGGNIRIEDPYYKIPVKLGARGQYGFKISDGAVFLKKMIGTLHSATTDKVYEQFRGDIVEGMKVHLHSFMKQNNVGIVDIGSDMKNIAAFIKRELDPTFAEYGIELLNLNLEDIILDENDEGYKKIQDAIAERAKINLLGDKYQTARQFDVMDKAASNEGIAGGAMGAGLGAGLGFGMGGMMGNMQQQQQSQPPQQQPPQQSGPPPAAGAPPTPAVAEIYLSVSGETYGPYSIEQLKEFAQQKSFTKESLVWKAGMENWVKAGAMPELMPVFATPGAPPPPPPPPPSK